MDSSDEVRTPDRIAKEELAKHRISLKEAKAITIVARIPADILIEIIAYKLGYVKRS